MKLDPQPLFLISNATAKAVALRELQDPSKFSTELAAGAVDSSCEFVNDLFSIFSRVSVVYGDMDLRWTDVATVDIDGTEYVRFGYDANAVELLLDAKGLVYEWDGMVLDGPTAPSGWHHIVWICHLIYRRPLDAPSEEV